MSTTDGPISVTGAAYHIEHRNIIASDPATTSLEVQGGRYSSQSVELTAALSSFKSLRPLGGASYADARYDELNEVVAGTAVSRRDNSLINMPPTTLNASVLYTTANEVTLRGSCAMRAASTSIW